MNIPSTFVPQMIRINFIHSDSSRFKTKAMNKNNANVVESGGHRLSIEVEAVTFDDFGTLRYSAGEKEDIIFPIMRALKKEGVNLRKRDFLQAYFRIDTSYHKMKSRTLQEHLLDDIIAETLEFVGSMPKNDEIIKRAVNSGLKTRKTRWYPDSIQVLQTLREKGYNLGLISNTHWRFLDDLRRKFEAYFDVITLSYEHGYMKPHSSIFLVTLERLRVNSDHCLHVGDDPEADIEGAKRLGIKTVFVRRKAKETRADLQISQLRDLLSFL